MLKIAGTILVLLGALGIAGSRCMQYQKRYEELCELEEITAFFHSEICRCRNTIPEILHKTGQRTKEPYVSLFGDILSELKKNSSGTFSQLWKICAGSKRKEFCLNEEEFDILLNFGHALEQDHVQMHGEALRLEQENIHERVKGLRGEMHERRRLSLCLGTMGGLFIIVVLL